MGAESARQEEAGILRVLYLHLKGLEGDLLESQRDALSHTLVTLTGNPQVEVITGYEDFAHRASNVGGWDAWIHEVAADMTYSAFVVDCPSLGKATAGIVDAATNAGRHVYLWTPETGEMRQVVGVDVDGSDWKHWGRVLLAAIG